MRLAASVVLIAILGASSLGAQASNAAAPAGASLPATAAALGVERSVPVATHALGRGVALTASDYQIATVTLRSALRDAAAADLGWVTRRAIAPGEPLVVPAVGPPALVTAGQPVTFIAEAGGVHLAIQGTAATAGALGDRVWVRMDSGRRLRGLVTSAGTVWADTTSFR